MPVICNFNVADKLSPETFALWLRVLQRVPRAVLWLLTPHSNRNYSSPNNSSTGTGTAADSVGSSAQSRGAPHESVELTNQQNELVMRHLRAEAARLGVGPDRLLFAGRVSKADHIRR